jgi:hypothetical protein
MPDYLIAFNAEWVPELTDDEIMAAVRTSSALAEEMKAAGVLVFAGGLDDDSLVSAVDVVDGKPMLLDGPYVETKEHLGGFCVVNVPDEETARQWAARMAVACGWPQHVHRFMAAPHLPEDPAAG